MKKILLLSALCFTLSPLSAQIEIWLMGETTDVSGTTINLGGGESIKQDFTIKNMTGADTKFKMVRKKLDETDGTSDYLCFGEKCYPEDIVAPENPFISPDAFDVTKDEESLMVAYYLAKGNVGESLFRYYITDEADKFIDSVDVRYNSTVSIEEENNSITTSVFPNPAKDLLNIVINGNVENANITIYNLQGAAVLNENLQKGQNSLNLATFEKGIYLYVINDGEDILEKRKLEVL